MFCVLDVPYTRCAFVEKNNFIISIFMQNLVTFLKICIQILVFNKDSKYLTHKNFQNNFLTVFESFS